jgi:hypothetical protein
MNTNPIGLVSVIPGTIRKARGIEMRPGTLARATLALLLLSAWGAASAHGDEQRVPHVRPLVTGGRTVPIPAPSAASFASIGVTIPSTTLPGTYVLLACADDTKLVAENTEANNCRTSGTAVVVAP